MHGEKRRKPSTIAVTIVVRPELALSPASWTRDGAYLAALGPGAQDDHLEANADRYEQLLAETGLTLQIALHTGAFEHGGLKPGRYVMGGIPARWRRED